MPTQNLTINGQKQKGAGYHNINTGIQTFEFQFSNWSGELKIQATLALDPTETDWFDVNLTNVNDGSPLVIDRDSTDYDSSVFANAKGNFVWIRAVGTTDSGSITKIQYNH
jgi:hypothetical protein